FTSPPAGTGVAGAAGCLPEAPSSGPRALASPSEGSSLKSGSKLFCAVRFGESLGASRCTSPRTGFFSADGTASGSAASAVVTALPPSAESEALSGLEASRSEEHTSELQSLAYLVCRL